MDISGPCPEATAFSSLWDRVVFMTVPIMAIPIVPPRLRNSVEVAVATPSMAGATAFCTVNVNTGIARPRPIPKMIMLATAIAILFIKAMISIAATINGMPIRA
ncbi:hypothetical protein D3C75_799980 [compost metagenome]